jgi:predicted nuclease of restriction endonuclease-like (RecB) superfamily
MSDTIKSSVIKNIKSILNSARKKAYSAVNFAMVEAYWNIGRIIFEEQGSNKKAEYGDFLIKNLSKQLTSEYGKGFEQSNLRRMRQFYISFPIRDALRHELSWTHYRLIMKIENADIQNFYIDECIQSSWSTRELERQINSFYYERLLSSQDKNLVESNMKKHLSVVKPEDIVKDPYVLEFLGIDSYNHLFEKDLENALIKHLQKFLLELGKGFSFVAKQKRITVDGRHFFIDLVFYNYLLKCFVLIDLKVKDLTHQDLGQLQMYVNYYSRELMNEGDNPPIGILLCADKSDAVVKYTLPENNQQIFASKYKLYLPTEEELKIEIERERKLVEIEKSFKE